MSKVSTSAALAACLLVPACAGTRLQREVIPHDLEVRVAVIDEPRPSDGKNACIMQFRRDGAVVSALGRGTVVTCNGVSMPYNDLVLGFAKRIPAQPVGGVYRFACTTSEGSTVLDVVVPARPRLVSPTQGARVARQANTSVSYVPGAGDSVEVSARHRDGSSSSAGPQPDTGSYSGLDTRSLPPGPGTLRLTRRTDTLLAGTRYRAASSSYETSTVIDVTWQ